MHFLVYVIMEICWVLHALDLVYFGGQSGITALWRWTYSQRQLSLVC